MNGAKTMQKTARELRRTVIDMIYEAGSGHSGGSLSCAEILTVLYDEIMRIDPARPEWEERDRFILSKGHAAPALYATLAHKGFFDPKRLPSLRKLGSGLEGHPCMFKLAGIDMSTGSLGLGISAGVGMALAAKQKKQSYRVFVLCGDGELQEGQNWEAFAAAGKWKLDNLTVIVDHNRVQLDGTTEQVMPSGDLSAKISAFGLYTVQCDGHHVSSLLDAFQQAEKHHGPAVIIADTVKGKGVSFMEGQAVWHGKQISDENYKAAIKEIREEKL